MKDVNVREFTTTLPASERPSTDTRGNSSSSSAGDDEVPQREECHDWRLGFGNPVSGASLAEQEEKESINPPGIMEIKINVRIYI